MTLSSRSTQSNKTRMTLRSWMSRRPQARSIWLKLWRKVSSTMNLLISFKTMWSPKITVSALISWLRSLKIQRLTLACPIFLRRSRMWLMATPKLRNHRRGASRSLKTFKKRSGREAQRSQRSISKFWICSKGFHPINNFYRILKKDRAKSKLLRTISIT